MMKTARTNAVRETVNVAQSVVGIYSGDDHPGEEIETPFSCKETGCKEELASVCPWTGNASFRCGRANGEAE